ASAGGSGTSNELSNSMTLPLAAGADHVRRSQLLPDPARAAEQSLVGVARRHELNADRQSIRAAVGRQGERGDVENGPDRLEAGVAGFAEAARRLAVGARREQHVDLLEHGGDPPPPPSTRAGARGGHSSPSRSAATYSARDMARPRSMRLRSRSLIASRWPLHSCVIAAARS